MAVFVIVGLSLVVLIVALVLYQRAYHLFRLEKPQRSHTRRRSQEQMLWEVGRPLADLRQGAHSISPVLKRRGFLARLALGLLGASAAHSAAHGKTLADVEDFLTSSQRLDHAENTKLAWHGDGGGRHIDVPGPGGYADTVSPHSDHYDNPPPPPHRDTPPPHRDTPPPPRPHLDTPHGDSN
jgi:hypothetical protein